MTNEDSSHGPTLNLSFLSFFPSLSFDDFFSFLESFLDSFAFFFAFFFCDKHEGWEACWWMDEVGLCSIYERPRGLDERYSQQKNWGEHMCVCVDSKAEFRLG